MADLVKVIALADSNAEVLSREVLIALNKGELQNALTTGRAPETFEVQVCRATARTIRSNELDAKHLIAACDTAKILLKNLNPSIIPEVWMQMFEAAAHLFGRGKTKPAREILRSLVLVLPAGSFKASIQQTVVSSAVEVFLTNKPSQSLAFSMAVVEHFLKDSMSIEQLARIGGLSLLQIDRSWVAYMDQYCLARLAQNALDSILQDSDFSALQEVQLLACIRALITTLFVSAVHTESPSAVGRLLQALITKLKTQNANSSPLRVEWVPALHKLLLSHPSSLDRFMAHVFPILYKHDRVVFVSLLEYASDMNKSMDIPDCDVLFRLAVIGYLKKIGHIESYLGLVGTLESAFGSESYLGCTASDILGSLSQHANAAIRIHVFGLLVASEKTNQGIASDMLDHVKQALPYLHGLHDPQLRNNAFSLVRQLIDRIIGIYERLGRANSAQALETGQERNSYVDFSRWYCSYLFGELSPTASYPRHVFALQVLLQVLESLSQGPMNTSVRKSCNHLLFADVFRAPSLKIIFDLLLDPFEDVRQLASRNLQACIRSLIDTASENDDLEVSTEKWPPKLISEALTNGFRQPFTSTLVSQVLFVGSISASVVDPLKYSFWKGTISVVAHLATQTNRADHADGFGRLFELYFLLVTGSLNRSENKTSKAVNLATTRIQGSEIVSIMLSQVGDALPQDATGLDAPLDNIPLHGCLYGLRYCIQYLTTDQCISAVHDRGSTLAERVIYLCEKVWKAVRDRLCIDAPERETEEFEESEALAGPKDMLSYSWRALRDSSLVLHALLSTKFFSPKGKGHYPAFEIYERIGTLCMEQMTALRHRGAFSTVSRTFELFCQRCATSQVEVSRGLLLHLFEAGKIRMVAMDDKTTRRSAGFPSFMSAILIAKDRNFFNSFVEEFSYQAMLFDHSVLEKQTSLPQVHFLNCLREVFLNSQLRDWSVLWLEKGLTLASNCVVSSIWAIRNCGLMLLRAVISRLSRGKKSQKISSPALYEEDSRIPVEQSSKITEVALQLLIPELGDNSYLTKGNSSSSNPIARLHASNSHITSKMPLTKFDQDPETLCMAMDLIGRISFKKEEEAVSIQSLLASLLAHKAWLVRDQAARTYSRLVDEASSISPLLSNLRACKSSIDQNEIHGRLLCTRYILSRSCLQGNKQDVNFIMLEIESSLRSLGSDLSRNETHPAVQAAFLDILNDCLKSVLAIGSQSATSGAFNDLIGISQSFAARIRWRNSFSLLLRSTTLNRWLLLLLTSHDSQKLFEMPQTTWVPDLEDVATVDPDALRYSLMELSNIELVDYNSKFASTYLHLASLRHGRSEDVIALAARRFADLIGSSAEDNKQMSRSLGLPELFDWLDTHDSGLQKSRNRWTAILCLRAALIKLDSLNTISRPCSFQTCRFCRYLEHLRCALNDEIDLPTRLAGLESLTYLEHILANELASLPGKHRGPVIVALYDLLSDDDEEIRERAASTASAIYSKAVNLTTRRQPLTAAAVGPSLLLQIAATYDDGELCQVGIQRLFIPSFQQAIESTRNEHKDVLFEEEKQNLYRDDVQEARVWAAALITMSPPPLMAYQVAISEGLAYLLDCNTLTAKPLRTNTEIFVLCIRLVLSAEVLLIWQGETETARLLGDVKIFLSDRWILPEIDDLRIMT